MPLVDDKYKLWRGPRPRSLGDVRNQGVERLINLESGFYQGALATEGLVVREFPPDFGMVEYNMPCSDLTPPEDFVVEKVCSLVMDAIPTYIHCLSGVDRTGYVCAAYRMRVCGWTYSAAVGEFRALGRHAWYWWWEGKLKKWAM